MFLELPVTFPPRVKALMVRVPEEEAMVSVLIERASRVWDTEALEPNQELPDIEAVPPTSKEVFMKLPALIPSLPVELVSSKLPDTEALVNEVRPVTERVPESMMDVPVYRLLHLQLGPPRS